MNLLKRNRKGADRYKENLPVEMQLESDCVLRKEPKGPSSLHGLSSQIWVIEELNMKNIEANTILDKGVQICNPINPNSIV